MHSMEVQPEVTWVIPERGARQRKASLKDGTAARHVEGTGHHRAAPAAAMTTRTHGLAGHTSYIQAHPYLRKSNSG